jgi:hypothetical protein
MKERLRRNSAEGARDIGAQHVLGLPAPLRRTSESMHSMHGKGFIRKLNTR